MLVAAGLVGCASTSEPYDETRGWSVEKIYAEARDELNSGNYTRAVKLYETLQARYPYGRYAQQALMDQAYTHYKDSEPELAVAAINRFARLYPAHPNLDYMYYLKGLVFYNDDSSALAKWAGQDMSERDSKTTTEAYQAFRELVTRFPQSQYAPDATAKMEYLVKSLGGYQMHVARYYMKRGAWLAAANRAQDVVKEYGNTGNNEEALAIMVAAYDQLGMDTLRDDARRVLQTNFPSSAYLNKPWQAKESSWWRFW